VLDSRIGHDVKIAYYVMQCRDKGHGRVLANRMLPVEIAQSRSLDMPLRIDLPAFLLDIVKDGR
jgi:hypothetical protein